MKSSLLEISKGIIMGMARISMGTTKATAHQPVYKYCINFLIKPLLN